MKPTEGAFLQGLSNMLFSYVEDLFCALQIHFGHFFCFPCPELIKATFHALQPTRKVALQYIKYWN